MNSSERAMNPVKNNYHPFFEDNTGQARDQTTNYPILRSGMLLTALCQLSSVRERLNSLPNDKILDQSKLKAIADKIVYMT